MYLSYWLTVLKSATSPYVIINQQYERQNVSVSVECRLVYADIIQLHLQRCNHSLRKFASFITRGKKPYSEDMYAIQETGNVKKQNNHLQNYSKQIHYQFAIKSDSIQRYDNTMIHVPRYLPKLLFDECHTTFGQIIKFTEQKTCQKNTNFYFIIMLSFFRVA